MYMHIYTYDILERLRTRKHATHARTHAHSHARTHARISKLGHSLHIHTYVRLFNVKHFNPYPENTEND